MDALKQSMHYKRTHDGLCTIPIRDRFGWSKHLLTLVRTTLALLYMSLLHIVNNYCFNAYYSYCILS